MGNRYEYAMYRGDQFLAIGTKEELCKFKGINENSFSFLQSPVYRQRIKNYDKTIFIIRIGGKKMKLSYKDLKGLVQATYKEYKNQVDQYIESNPDKDLDRDSYFNDLMIREQTLKWLIWDIEELEGDDNE